MSDHIRHDQRRKCKQEQEHILHAHQTGKVITKLFPILGYKDGVVVLDARVIDELVYKNQAIEAKIKSIRFRPRDVLYLCFDAKNVKWLDQEVDDQEKKNIICKLFFQGAK